MIILANHSGMLEMIRDGRLVFEGKENKTLDWELVFHEVVLSKVRDTIDKEIDMRKFESLEWMIELKHDLGARLELNKPKPYAAGAHLH